MAASSAVTSKQSRAPRADRDKTGPTNRRPKKATAKRYGSTTPRVYTPPLVEGPAGPCGCGCAHTKETTLGFLVIEFAAELLMIELLPWQKWLLIHMLELLPDNSLRFRTVVVLVSRQNGKSTLSQVLALWMMYVYGLKLVLGTAQDLDTAEEVWQAAVDLVTEVDDETDEPVRPELAEMVNKVVQVNGKKALVINSRPGGGGGTRRWKVKAANRKAGRGLSGELILLDELREHQSWDAWGSITKTTIAKAMALILAMSNAGDTTSIVLRHLRLLAHERIGDPDGIVAAAREDEALGADTTAPTEEDLEEFEGDAEDLLAELDDSLGLFEWSAHPERDVHDRDGWCEANPSLGYTITERTLASAAATDPEWVFRTECLCQWPGGTLSGPFEGLTWDNGRWDPREGAPPKIVGDPVACVSMSHDRRTTSITIAGRIASGVARVEHIAMRAGSDWVLPWFTDPEKPHRRKWRITGLKKGPEGELLKDLKAEGLNVVEWAGDDVPGWTGEFYDLVSATELDDAGNVIAGLTHLPSPHLDIAAGNAVTKPSGLRFVWHLEKSPVDVHSLIGATGAIGLLLRKAPPTPPVKPRTVRSRTSSISRTGF